MADDQTTMQQLAVDTAEHIAEQDRAAERVLTAEQSARPFEIPRHFQRDTTDETLEAVLTSYTNAQRKINELGQTNAELRATLEEYEQSQYAAPDEPEQYGWPLEPQPQYVDPAPVQPFPQVQPLSPDALAARTHQAVQDAIASTADAPANDLLGQAEQIVLAQIPNFKARAAEVSQMLNQRPDLVEGAMQSGDPHAVAEALGAAYNAVTANEISPDLMRTMKIAAQTASGGAGRPSPVSAGEQRWSEIVNAPTGKLDL